VDLRRCLLQPRTIHTISASGEQEQDVWLVLHEAPGGGDGFGVAFDEATGTFGLVEFRHGYDACLLGHYGDFFAALEGM
jgi:hypothetical protein